MDLIPPVRPRMNINFNTQSERLNINSSNNSSNKAGNTRYPDSESDNIQRKGKVYIVRNGVGNMSDSQTILHHWAVAVKFDDRRWVVIEGVNEEGMLLPGYCKSQSKPDGTFIEIDDSPTAGLGVGRYKLHEVVAVTVQKMKAMSLEIVRSVRASPKDLHQIAGSIPMKPYCPGTTDCQTWVLDALRKLKSFEIGNKSFGECAYDTLRAPVKTVTATAFKAASTVTSTGLEAANTVVRVLSDEENPAFALVDGARKTTSHFLNGVSDTVSVAVDGVAGFAGNAMGCATINVVLVDIRSLQEDVNAGRMHPGAKGYPPRQN